MSKLARGTNVFHDAVQDTEQLAQALRALDSTQMNRIDIFAMRGAVARLADSLTKVLAVDLQPGDQVDMELQPQSPTDYPSIEVSMSYDEDVLESMDEEGFWDEFADEDQRRRAMHAFASLDRERFDAQFCGIGLDGNAVWAANGVTDAVETHEQAVILQVP